MLGVYDSGSGGLCALSRLKERAPYCDILYRGDVGHAPYGVKERGELLPIIRENLALLRTHGCSHILVACVTASSLCPYLPPEELSGVYPITEYTALAACRTTRTGRVGIVSTTRTMREGVLRRALIGRGIFPCESAADDLVVLAEHGRTSSEDAEVARAIRTACAPHIAAEVDTLILGCTHFPLFEAAFREQMGARVALINSAAEGADAFLKEIQKSVLYGTGHVQFV